MQVEAKPGVEPKRGMSGRKKVLLGCGCLTILGLLVCGGLAGYGVWYGIRYGIRIGNEFAKPFEEQGYERVTTQQLTETETVESPKVYMAQQLVIQEGSKADLAICCQMAELHGTFEGDIDFLGQLLHVKPDAVVKGDIRVKGGQVITIEGVVEGEISGSYQVLDDRRPKGPSEDSMDTEATEDAADQATGDQAQEAAEDAPPR
jgi:hypothetical protein